ncbi:MAG: hypothetical protein GXO00_01195 [Candidatus Diapherotrites archaeon]|nr:hypothetical protein [Candidatus Diapherotrites archaeon]
MDDFERAFLALFSKVMQAFSAGALGVRISVTPEGDVFVDPIQPRRRKIYVPFGIVDDREYYVLTLDLRHLPRRATTVRITPTGVLVETPKGERFIYFEEFVVPEETVIEERDGIVELTIPKGSGKGEKVIRFPE